MLTIFMRIHAELKFFEIIEKFPQDSEMVRQI